MRDQFNHSLKQAVLDQDRRRACTLRLINAAIKDRDIAARTKGNGKMSDTEILELLATMVKQREESQTTYEDAGRLDLAEQEAEEIIIIREFMPRQLDDQEVASAVRDVITEVGASGLRDMGKIMATLKSRFPGQIDACHASKLAKAHLAAHAH